MIDQQKVIAVMPAYNVAATLERAYRAIPRDVVDEVILVNDGSRDETAALAQRLGLITCHHPTNRGYGAAQKTGYQAALDRGAAIVVMVHPDDQYPPELAGALAHMVASRLYHVALGSRMLGSGALRRGMPLYKFLSNRVWTWGQNLCIGRRVSEYHTGARAYSRTFLLHVPVLENSDDFLFDNHILLQAVYYGYAIGELSIPARFTADCSSMHPWRGIIYGLGIIGATWQYWLQRSRLARVPRFEPTGQRLADRPVAVT